MSKYEPLSRRLRGHPADEWRASFSEIEDVLGFPLPKGARAGRAWWAGDKPHARAWTGPGWQAGEVDPAAGRVTFRRGDIAPATVAAVLEPVGEIAAAVMPKVKRVKPPAADGSAETPAVAAEDRRKAHPIALVAGVAAAVTVLAGLAVLGVRAWSRRD